MLLTCTLSSSFLSLFIYDVISCDMLGDHNHIPLLCHYKEKKRKEKKRKKKKRNRKMLEKC